MKRIMMLIAAAAALLTAGQAAADTVTATWDAYVDGTVSAYQASNYEIQVTCRVNAAAHTQRARVAATANSATFTVALVPGDELGCLVKAYRKSNQEWGDPSVEVVVRKSSTPSAPGGLQLKVTP